MALLEDEDGLDQLFGLVRRFLPSGSGRRPMRWPATWPPPTAAITEPEARMLEEIREELGIDRLHAPPSSGARGRGTRDGGNRRVHAGARPPQAVNSAPPLQQRLLQPARARQEVAAPRRDLVHPVHRGLARFDIGGEK